MRPDRRHGKRWWALTVVALAQFMVIMDTSIIGVTLPRMQADLGFSQASLSWVFNAYVVAFSGLCCCWVGASRRGSSWPGGPCRARVRR